MSQHPYRRLVKYFARYRRALGLGAACLLVGRLLLTWAPELLRRGINALSAGTPGSAQTAMDAAYAFLGVTAVGALGVWGMRRLLVGASRDVERDIKRDLFQHLERLPCSWFDRMRTGDLMSRMTSDVEAVRFSLGPGLMYVLSTLITFPTALVLMARLSVPLMLATLVPLIGVLLFVKLVSPAIFRRTRAVQDRTGDLSARAQESFAGARVVRAYATEPIEVEAFRQANLTLMAETLALARLRAWMTAGLYVLGGLAEVVVLVLGGTLVTEGRLGTGDLTAYLAWVSMLIWPMISVGWVVSAFQRSGAAAARIEEVLSTPTEADAPDAAPLSGPIRGALSLRGLTFVYPGAARAALKDVSLEVPAGGTLALVGPVGSGKSTLLRLLARLYEPPPGTLFLDDVDVTLIPRATLRAALATVPQDAFLFSTSLAANLAYAVDPAPPRAALLEAATTAGLESDLEIFPAHLDTVVGERGITLSGGQKQRVTLARALLRPDAALLLLDDALSAVDTHTEETILEGLAQHLGRRTTLIAAHRLSTVRHATQVLVLDEGRVVEQGTHEQLLRAGGWYARTHAAQRTERALEELS